MGDVGDAIDAGRGGYDAILLDVDNGPDGLTRAGNDGLYSRAGLAAAKAALKPGGILAVWSAAPDNAFARRLGSAGFAVEEVAVRARAERQGPAPRHLVRRPALSEQGEPGRAPNAPLALARDAA